MNVSTFKIIVNVVGIASLCAGAYTVVKIWTEKSELGKEAKAQLKNSWKNRS